MMGGYIAYFDLKEWWETAFTESEQEYISTRFEPVSTSTEAKSLLTTGTIRMATEHHAVDFLCQLSSWFSRKPEDRSIYERIYQQVLREAETRPVAKPGYYKGRFMGSYVEEIKQLKREGRYKEAVAILLPLCDAAEAYAASSGCQISTWYREHLNIVYRKQSRGSGK